MVTPYISLQNYVVISTLVGCLSAFQLYDYTPTDTGDFHRVEASNGTFWQFQAKNLGAEIGIKVFGADIPEDVYCFASKSKNCDHRVPLTVDYKSSYSIVVTGIVEYQQDENYFCFIESKDSSVIEGKNTFKFLIKEQGLVIPSYVRIICSLFLLCLSGLFSGLNLGLMSLDLTSLRILIETGSVQEKRYAKSIEPVRKQGNFLLCTLLLGNVLVNNTLTILLDGLFGGVLAVVGATAGIVVMG